MIEKSTFTADEWNTLLGSIVMSGIAVTAAEPSGLIGLFQEGLAGGKHLLEQVNKPDSDLLRLIAHDFRDGEGRSGARAAVNARVAGATRDDIKSRAMAAVDEAMAIVRAKAPAEAPAFGRFLLKVADSTANAASEGGFLGFGGTRVTAAEKTAVDDIARRVGAA